MKYGKLRKRGKVKSILNYSRDKYDRVGTGYAALSKPARTFYTNELDSLVPRLKLRARGQTQPSRAELSYEMAKQRLRHGKKAKSIRKKPGKM